MDQTNIYPATPSDVPFLKGILAQPKIVARGFLFDALTLPAPIAKRLVEPVRLITYAFKTAEC